MRRIDGDQGSDAWIKARLGIPTASAFDRIVTPKTRKYSAGAEKYIAELIGERLLGREVTDRYETPAMTRGTDMEQDAVNWYSFSQGVEVVERVGLCLHDIHDAGGSPDGLVGENGGLEVKCPMPTKHILNCLGQAEIAPVTQVQGNLWATGREWWDVLSYHQDLTPKLIRVEADEDWLRAFDEHIPRFLEELQAGLRVMGGQTLEDQLAATLAIQEIKSAVADGVVSAEEHNSAVMLASQGQWGMLQALRIHVQQERDR